MASQDLTIKRIRKANASWLARIRQELHDIQFDSSADILYISYGEPAEAFSVPLNVQGEDVFLRVEPKTFKIKGIEILNFRKVFLSNHADAKKAFFPYFKLLGDSDWRIQIRMPAEQDSGQVALDYFPAYVNSVAPEMVAA